MKFAKVIGRVTLSRVDPAYKGSRFLVAMPSGADEEPGLTPQAPFSPGNSVVVYDNLGATVGDLIGFSDGGEAAAPFAEPTPCDAYNAAILDRCHYQPPVRKTSPNT